MPVVIPSPLPASPSAKTKNETKQKQIYIYIPQALGHRVIVIHCIPYMRSSLCLKPCLRWAHGNNSITCVERLWKMHYYYTRIIVSITRRPSRCNFCLVTEVPEFGWAVHCASNVNCYYKIRG